MDYTVLSRRKVLSTCEYKTLSNLVLAEATPEITGNLREIGRRIWDRIVTEKYKENIKRSPGYHLVCEYTACIFAEKVSGISVEVVNPHKRHTRTSVMALLDAYLKRLAHRIRYEQNLLQAIIAHKILTIG